MHLGELNRWQHEHSFGTDAQTHGEHRTRWVVALTFTMMVAEVIAGMKFGSMAQAPWVLRSSR